MSYKELRKIEKPIGTILKHGTILNIDVPGYGFRIQIQFDGLIKNLANNMIYSLMRDLNEELSRRGGIKK